MARVWSRANRIAKEFEFSDQDARNAVLHFLKQLDEGLRVDGTNLSQLPTFVTGVPTGREKGLYLAVDLGGTNLRVCSVLLTGDKSMSINPRKPANLAIPQAQMEAETASELFRWVAQEIEAFLIQFHQDDLAHHNSRNPYKLGFSFSHAYEQQGINKGVLLRWSKAFNIPDAVGQDVCALLQIELDRLGLPVLVTALVNDTTGTLLARSYEAGGDPKTVMGAIFGTGTNGAYFEKLDDIHKLRNTQDMKDESMTGEMIINTEWGGFDDDMILLPNTKFDQAVDDSCVNPLQEMFEKRISGLYLGEILRHAILDLYATKPHDKHFRLPRPEELKNSPLNVPWEIDSSFLSNLASENTTGQESTEGVVASRLKTYLDTQVTFIAAGPIKMVSLAIAKRAARLSAVAIAAIVIRSGLLANLQPVRGSSGAHLCMSIGTAFSTINTLLQRIFSSRTSSTAQHPKPQVDIGVTGSLWEKYPGFESMVREVLRIIPGIGPEGEKRIRIGIADNGSLVGAALAAAVGDGDLDVDHVILEQRQNGSPLIEI